LSRRLLHLTAGAAVLLSLGAADAIAGPPANRSAAALEVALIADTPYGDRQRTQFPALVESINADPQVRMVLHAGDVKNGSSTCDDARFADLAALYGTFADPFVLTPGDNEWTDCHRPAAGRYLPVERLEAVRDVFFPEPGRTLGRRSTSVTTQAADPAHAAYVENVRFTRSRVVFATVHVVGSENDLEPWAGLVGGDRPELRLAEFRAREAAALSWIDAAFDEAEAERAAGVLLMLRQSRWTPPASAPYEP
jgi:hypothetical protein